MSTLESDIEDAIVSMKMAAQIIKDQAEEIKVLRLEIVRLKVGLDIIEEYSGSDGHRCWSRAGVWLYPGQVVAVVNKNAAS